MGVPLTLVWDRWVGGHGLLGPIGRQMANLDKQTFRAAAAEYARELSRTDVESLFGLTDGKAVGTFVEHQFN